MDDHGLVPGAIPDRLTKRDRWGIYRTGGEKTPSGTINPLTEESMSRTDPSTWLSFEEVCQAASDAATDVDALAYMPTVRGPFAHIVLQHALDPDTQGFTDWSQLVLEQLDSYAEVMPATNKIRIVVAGDRFFGTEYPQKTDGEIVLDTKLPILLTGNHIAATPTQITDCNAALHGLFTTYMETDEYAEETTTLLRETTASELGTLPEPITEVTLTDDQIIKHACEGPTGDVFTRLWNGDTTGYSSVYEADVATACHLAYWTGGDGMWIYRLLWQWSSMPERLLTFIDGQPYSTAVVTRACELTDEHYTHPSPPDTDIPATRAAVAELDPITTVDLSDRELRRLMLNAADGIWLAALWNRRDLSPAQNETVGDMVLCHELAYWTGGDAAQIDRLFRRSRRMTDRWDESTGTNSTYGADLIRETLSRQESFHTQKHDWLRGY
jgi:putative DNA primase/helicase